VAGVCGGLGVIDWLLSNWNSLIELISRDWNSGASLIRLLILPIVFSGFGAYFGAKMAASQRDREQKYASRKEALHQLSDLSMMVGSLCNSVLMLKKHHVREMMNDFALDRVKVARYFGIPTAEKEPIKLRFSLQGIFCPPLETSELMSAIVRFRERGSSDLLQGSAVRQSCRNIERLIERRDEWIADFKKKQSSLDHWNRLALYFGFPSGEGSLDEEYKGFVEGISGATDDAIFHSYQLHIRFAKQLVEMASTFEKQYGEKFRFSILNFEPSREDGLFPDNDRYATWLQGEQEVLRRKWFGRAKWKSDILSKIG
jgi:hypothetical protein